MSTVRGFLSSADLSTGVDIPLFDENGAAVTLAADERVEVHWVAIHSAVAAVGTVTFFDDADDDNAVDAGETFLILEVYDTNIVANASMNFRGAPILCTPGIPPHVIAAAAGQVEVFLGGVVRRVN